MSVERLPTKGSRYDKCGLGKEEEMTELTREEIVEQRVTDFMHCFSGPCGERTLKYLSKFCLEHESTYVEGSGRKSDLNEGARLVILEIRRWLEFDLTKVGDESKENNRV